MKKRIQIKAVDGTIMSFDLQAQRTNFGVLYRIPGAPNGAILDQWSSLGDLKDRIKNWILSKSIEVF